MNKAIIFACAYFICSAAFASLIVPVYLTDDVDQTKSIGTITIEKDKYGVLLTPHLTGLPPGVHGFHIHDHASCADHGMAAGGHLDPAHTEKHEGPYSKGHLGDLPPLIVDQNGNANLPVLAPRLSMEKLAGHTIMIHAGSDNYSDSPEKLGGGGARIACGVIK